MNQLKPIHSELLLANQPLIQHGFFTRDGGVSTGIYDGLNVGLGSGDDPQSVLENRTMIASTFGLEYKSLVTAYQVHSDRALYVSKPLVDEKPQVDALVTDKTGIAIGILTADCGPVLFSDPDNHVIGAAHAGWKGATGGILENTVLEMEKTGANRNSIKAVLGPTISRHNYEVGPEFAARLVDLDSNNHQYLGVSKKPDHHMFDLPTYIVDRLEKFGVEASWTGDCTYEFEDKFFSYRRTTHRNEPDYGRQMSVISLQK